MNDAENQCGQEIKEVGLRERLENARRHLADQLAHVQLALDELAADPTLERKIEIVRRAGR